MPRSLNAEIRRRMRKKEYDSRTHRILRDNLRPLVAAGGATCAICKTPITAGAPWDLAHAANRNYYLGPAHERCNRDTAPKPEEERTSRPW